MKYLSLIIILLLSGCLNLSKDAETNTAQSSNGIEQSQAQAQQDESAIVVPEESNENNGVVVELGSVVRTTVQPVIADHSDVYINHKSGDNLSVRLSLSNQDSLDGLVYWTKTYGPDGVKVHPITGEVTWDIPNNMPSESFHVGIKASGMHQSAMASVIIHAGVENVVTVGRGGDYATIKAGLAAISSGDTLVVLDGQYSGNSNFIGLTSGGSVQHPPSGNSQAYTTIMAKHPGQVILEDGAYVRLHGNWPVSYAAFKGFYVVGGQMAVFGYGKNKNQSSDRHHHIKFIRNGVAGGESMSPFNAFRSDDILFENNYALGGGRYKFTSYEAENIVWRRNVARYDRGTVSGEPKGTYSVYATNKAFLGNNIAVDGDNPDFVNQGELAGEFATPTTSGSTVAKFHRNMQVNSAFLFGNMDDQLSGGGGDSDVEHTDVVSWDVKPYSRYVMTWGSAWFDHMTMGDIVSKNYATNFFNGYHENTRGVTNSILHNFQNGDMFYGLSREENHKTIGRVVDRYGVNTVNITDFYGTLNVYNSDIENVTNVNPLASNGGLRYLTRIEPNSELSKQASDGGDVGATVMTFIGKSGTLYGEDGFDEETGIPMWPFPSEDLIKDKFSQYSYTGPTYAGHYNSRVKNGTGTISGARGFAVDGESLTNYIWGYLGEIVPPMSVSAALVEGGVLVQWSDATQGSNLEITGYKVYSYNKSTGEKLLLSELGVNSKLFFDESTEVNSEYSYVVTAYNVDSESGFSYPVTVNIP